MTYNLLGRCKDGVKVIGYLLEDSAGLKVLASKKDFEELVLKRLVLNCSGQNYRGKVYIKGKGCKLVDLPIFDINGNLITKAEHKTKITPYMAISKRITKGKDTIAYEIMVSQNNETLFREVSRSEAIELAKMGCFINARVQRYDGRDILRGVNCELSQLPIIKY